MEYGSFKDFESVRLKATYNIEIGNRKIVPGETIAYFDKIQIAGLNDTLSYITAHGGYKDQVRVVWEDIKEVKLNFVQGVFSKEQFALMTNSRLFQMKQGDLLKVPMREYLESDENGIITCKYAPAHDVFVYKKEDGTKLSFSYGTKPTQLVINSNYTDVVVDYYYDYNNNVQFVKIGKNLLSGFVELEGITRVKDDTTGQVVTAIIKIPHLKLMSDLSIRLGNLANPVVGNFNGIAYPVGSRGNNYVVEFYYLSDDIQADL